MTKGTRLPEGWQPREADVSKMAAEFPGLDLAAELEEFRDYWSAKAGLAATKVNWDATYRMRMRHMGKLAPRTPLRVPQRPASHVSIKREPEEHHLLYFANQLLFQHMVERGGLGEPELTAALKVKRDTVEWFTEPVRQGDEMATPKEFVTQFATALGKVSRLCEGTRRAWWKYAKSESARRPFNPRMGRAL
jgi:hypothetical protein